MCIISMREFQALSAQYVRCIAKCKVVKLRAANCMAHDYREATSFFRFKKQ
jgi:hypothetical protein